jgi:DNA-binding transcriptional LysR family regulator
MDRQPHTQKIGHSRGFRLTVDGTALRPAAEALRAAASPLQEMAQAQRYKARALIRFTARDDAMNAELASAFAQFATEARGATFLSNASSRPLDLLTGEVDVALRLCGQQVGHTA